MQVVYDMWVHNTKCEEDNTPQVLQTLWIETCCTRETPSYPPRFQEHRHSPEKDVQQSINWSIDQSIKQSINQSINQSISIYLSIYLSISQSIRPHVDTTFFTTTCLDCTRSSAPVKGTCSESGGRVWWTKRTMPLRWLIEAIWLIWKGVDGELVDFFWVCQLLLSVGKKKSKFLTKTSLGYRIYLT